ncbi:MAG: hypothetical protein JWN52_2370 [Actinomycetia bacterium]|nr:hypothetical protein [Actinomycetes bacterium]
MTDIADVPPAVTEAGLKETDAPAGAPDAVRATDCALQIGGSVDEPGGIQRLVSVPFAKVQRLAGS